ncbi:hypothetical protein [Candidatus Kuenenia sp.]|uniref:hypothetical protein n=1 Tax=Candidatus Kuenenia sp. TaxID=2499824 RepID=UPI0032202F6B
MSKIIGCSLDGMKDRFFINGVQSPKSKDFCLADAILPSQYGGKFLVGDEAKQSHIACGFHWPPGASILEGHLRRVPVPWAWRLLVDAKDKFARWNVGSGVSFNVSKILAEHIAGRLGDYGKNADYVVVAIPNHLDEFGQEALIKDITSLGIVGEKKPYLLWRPVAAALAWLDKVQDQFEKPIYPEDFILVVHIGPDCFEFTTFRLREKYHNGKRFVIPLREQPKVEISLCGCDWGMELIQHIFEKDDLNTLWQVFINSPVIWETLAQRPWNKEKLPILLNRKKSENPWEWDLWEPEESLRDKIWQLEARVSRCLEELTKGNCSHRRSVLSYNLWQELLEKGVLDSLNNHKDGKLRGVILSGPLASINPVSWFKDIIHILESRGLCALITQEAKLDQIWAPSLNEDIVSEGAYIYGKRLSCGEPAYLDTLTQLYTLANKRGKQVWVPLLKKLEIEGGKPHQDKIEKIFSLNCGGKFLNVLLKKGDSKLFKKTQFHFPYTPLRDMPLDMNICVASAGGLAQVELVPEEKEFLGGARIFLDYNSMEDTDVLPVPKLGFPPKVLIIHVDKKDSKILQNNNFQKICNDFHQKGVYHPDYYRYVHRLRDELRKPISISGNSGNWISCRIVNQNGKTGTSGGQRIINKISKRLGDDLDIAVSGKLDSSIERVICSAATWLFGAASPKIYNYLRETLEKEIVISRHIIDGAGRCFKEDDDIKLFFRVAARQPQFNIHWMHAIWRILSLREDAPDIMERSHAEKFVKEALRVMETEASNNRYLNKFFQTVRMFLYVLRFRIKEPNFLSYNSPDDRQLLFRIIMCLRKGRQHYFKDKYNSRNHIQNRRSVHAAKLLTEIRKYMKYEGIIPNIDKDFEAFCSDDGG